jgi:phosphatidylinositol alpha-1,6-mannosyltransferase
VKVLYVTPGCFDKGGISRYCRYQLQAFRDLIGRDNVSAFSLLGPDEHSFEDGFEITWYAGGRAAKHKLQFCARVSAEALKFRPDLILCAHVNMSGWAHALARCVGARSVLNIYGMEVWSGFRRDARWGLCKIDEVISDCHFTADYVEAEGYRAHATTHVVWDCVDLERFRPQPVNNSVVQRYNIPDPSSFVNLLTLGRMSSDAAHKGYERLLEAFAGICDELPTLRLVFAGRGDMVELLRERARARGILERVHFTGEIHESDLPDVYRTAHIFSLVSDRGKGRGEGIPLTPLEAAACGVPIIVGNEDGSQEAVIRGENGFIVAPHDIASHRQAIRSLTENTTLRLAMATAARERIEREFSYETFREKHRRFVEADAAPYARQSVGGT